MQVLEQAFSIQFTFLLRYADGLSAPMKLYLPPHAEQEINAVMQVAPNMAFNGINYRYCFTVTSIKRMWKKK